MEQMQHKFEGLTSKKQDEIHAQRLAEVISQHEQELTTISQSLQKSQREADYQETQALTWKNRCSEQQEYIDKFEGIQSELEKELDKKQEEIDNFQPTLHQYEMRIGELHQAKKEHESGQGELRGQIADLEDRVEERERWRLEFQEDIARLKSQLLEKDEIVMSLTSRVGEKAEQNRRLAESLNIFKNQLVQDQLFENKYTVALCGTLTTTE